MQRYAVTLLHRYIGGQDMGLGRRIPEQRRMLCGMDVIKQRTGPGSDRSGVRGGGGVTADNSG
jgi:hypothetical protein